MIPENCPLKSESNVPVKCPCYNKANCGEIEEDKTLKEIQDLVFREYIKNGYLYMWNGIKNKNIADLAEISLVTTEVSEAIEIIRSEKLNGILPSIAKDNLGLECADIIIRTLNFMSRKQLSIGKYILKNYEKNLKRGKLHGKLI